jgi:hypothetical protein
MQRTRQGVLVLLMAALLYVVGVYHSLMVNQHAVHQSWADLVSISLQKKQLENQLLMALQATNANRKDLPYAASPPSVEADFLPAPSLMHTFPSSRQAQRLLDYLQSESARIDTLVHLLKQQPAFKSSARQQALLRASVRKQKNAERRRVQTFTQKVAIYNHNATTYFGRWLARTSGFKHVQLP